MSHTLLVTAGAEALLRGAAQGIAALMALNSLEQERGLRELGWGSAQHMHAAIESMRLAFADALAYNADPEVRCSTPCTQAMAQPHSPFLTVLLACTQGLPEGRCTSP